MAGVPGRGGPVPKRSGALSRGRDAKRDGRAAPTKGQARGGVAHPAGAWCPAIVRLYEGCQASGQADFYEQSDWGLLWLVCDLFNDQMISGKPSAIMVQALMKSLTELMVTEGARRRLRIELGQAPDTGDEDEADAHVLDLQAKLGLVK